MDEHEMRLCIERKAQGEALSAAEWQGAAASFTSGDVDDAQMAALCMACVLRGMSFDETHALTQAMVQSGETITYRPNAGIVVDKHSSGGVGDIVSLVAVPLAAAAGARVGKLAGRALGHTGGTIDKLESIQGFNAALSIKSFVAQVESIGCAISAQTDTLVPADRKLYRLRDRTGTIASLGLLASSIVSKKIAAGANGIVYDVKAGAGAFLRDPVLAGELAQLLVDLSQRFGRSAEAFVTDMSQPLGRTIGTGIEVVEAREFLQGSCDERAREVILAIASAMVEQARLDEPQQRVERALSSGAGYGKLLEMISAQGGDVRAFERMQLQPPFEIVASASGYVQAVDVMRLGNAARALSNTDPLNGLRIAVRIGDRVERGQTLFVAYGNDRVSAEPLSTAFVIRDQPVKAPPLIYERSMSATK